MVTLAIRRADLVGTERVVNLDGPSVIIGRSPTCTICLADQTVSRLHAEMTRHDDGTWSISSYKTAQKLWVNGVSVDASPLRGGETIRIGPYMIRFQLHAAESGTDERIAPCPAAVSAHDARKSATLFVEAGSPTLGRVPIVSPATVIGRSDACDLTIVAAQCADKQAEIHHVDNGFVLRDLGEESGVFLNGHRMNANTELATADIIALANGSPPARGHKRNAILRMVDAWQQWPAICQVGTAAALALAIVALFTAPAVMARASKSIAFVALRKIARETASTDNATPVAEEAASAAPVEEGHDDADPLTTELDADRESPAETVDPPSPPAAAPHLASSLATEPDATDDDRRAAAPSRTTLKNLVDQAEQASEAEDFPTEAASSSKRRAADSRPDNGHQADVVPATRFPVPPDDQVAAALKNVDAVYADKFVEPGQIAFLLPKLLNAAEQSAKPANKFALLLAAEREAVKASSFRAAVDAFNARAKAFEIDALQGRLDLLLNASKAKGDVAGGLFDLVVEVANEALATERFDIATKASVLASNVATGIDQPMKAKAASGGAPRPAAPDLSSVDSTHPVEIARRLRHIVSEAKKLRQKYQTALETLRETPDDEPSLEIFGKYRCFVMGDWQEGLPALAACRDEPLRDLASRELALKSDSIETAAILALAGHWWSFADAVKRSSSLPSETTAAAKRHAADLYQRIVADLDDPLESQLARKRIATAADEAQPRRPTER